MVSFQDTSRWSRFLTEQGGTLGFYCAHQYAHATNDANIRLPWALKGIDVVIFTVFQRLGLEVEVRPVSEKPIFSPAELDEMKGKRTDEKKSLFPPQTASLGTKFHATTLTSDLTEDMHEVRTHSAGALQAGLNNSD